MELIAEVKLYGEKLVPWSPPRTILGGRPGGKRKHVHLKDERLCAFQDAIRFKVRQQYVGNPYLGPVMLCFTFVKGTPDESKWGRPWWSDKPRAGHADLTNLLKAAEDALKTWHPVTGRLKGLVIPGVIEEDSQVCDGYQRKRWGPKDGMEVRIYGMEASDGHDGATAAECNGGEEA